jgi:hypothetical protein
VAGLSRSDEAHCQLVDMLASQHSLKEAANYGRPLFGALSHSLRETHMMPHMTGANQTHRDVRLQVRSRATMFRAQTLKLQHRLHSRLKRSQLQGRSDK